MSEPANAGRLDDGLFACLFIYLSISGRRRFWSFWVGPSAAGRGAVAPSAAVAVQVEANGGVFGGSFGSSIGQASQPNLKDLPHKAICLVNACAARVRPCLVGSGSF